MCLVLRVGISPARMSVQHVDPRGTEITQWGAAMQVLGLAPGSPGRSPVLFTSEPSLQT